MTSSLCLHQINVDASLKSKLSWCTTFLCAPSLAPSVVILSHSNYALPGLLACSPSCFSLAPPRLLSFSFALPPSRFSSLPLAWSLLLSLGLYPSRPLFLAPPAPPAPPLFHSLTHPRSRSLPLLSRSLSRLRKDQSLTALHFVNSVYESTLGTPHWPQDRECLLQCVLVSHGLKCVKPGSPCIRIV